MIVIENHVDGYLCIKAHLKDESSEVKVHFHRCPEADTDWGNVRQVVVLGYAGELLNIDRSSLLDGRKECDVW